MNNLQTAAQQALEILERLHGGCTDSDDGTVEAITVWCPEIIDALCAALAEPTVKESLQVESAVAEIATTQQQLDNKPPSDYRRGYWDGFAIGKREGRIEAEDALAEPVQEPCTYKCETWPECECAKPWQSAPPQRPAEPVQEPDSPERRCGGPGCDMTCCQPVQEPVAVTVEAVAEVIEKDGEPELCWLIEGGIYALAEGDILMIAHRSITGDDGSGEVYTAPPQNKENT